MKKFKVKFVREFEVQIQAENGAMASQVGSSIIAQFPKDTCKLLSIIAEDYVESECSGCAVDPMNPKGKPRGGPPNLGGNSGGTVVKVPVLVDQIAAAA